ncbi:MAG: cupin domain-containing protein [Solirubrobacterales bacterium]
MSGENFVVDVVDADGYEPDIIDGTQVGESPQIEPEGSASGKLDVSLWRSEPATYDYDFEGDEAFHVIEGAATVELLGTGETIDLRPGGVAHFRAGTKSVWTITEPFKKFVVISN